MDDTEAPARTTHNAPALSGVSEHVPSLRWYDWKEGGLSTSVVVLGSGGAGGLGVARTDRAAAVVPDKYSGLRLLGVGH